MAVARPSGRAPRGFTLLETVIVAALSMLFSYLVVAFLIPSLRLQSQGHQRAELVRLGNLAMEKMLADLRSCPAGDLSFDPATMAFSGRAQLDVTSDGLPVFSDRFFVVVPDAGQQRLMRREVPVTALPGESGLSPTCPSRLRPADLQLLTTWGSCQRVLCAPVLRFELQHSGAISAAPTPPYTITLQLGWPEGPQATYRQSMTARNPH